jgi:hypothetical protein
MRINYYRVRLAYRKRAAGYWFAAQRAYLLGVAPRKWRCGWCGKWFSPVPYQTVNYLRHKYQPNSCPSCRKFGRL